MNINKQKVLNLELTLEAGGRKIPQNILQSTWLERQNMKNETIFELYTDDNKSKYSSNPKDILQSAKKIMKLYTNWTFTVATTEDVSKISNIRKMSNEHFNLC